VNRARILIVDDELLVLDALQRMLRAADEAWELSFATSGRQAAQGLERVEVDVVLIDLRMPGLDGFELLTQLRHADGTRDLPAIMLTGANEPGLKRRALDLGATDLLTKPVDPDELIARIRSALRLKSYQDRLKHQNELLEQAVAERTAALAASRLDIIWRLGKAAEYRDEDTGCHVVRVGCYSRALARALRLPPQQVELISLASPLHDIGKIGIPDYVLRKPEALTQHEWAIMQQHCEIGAKILMQQSQAMSAALSRSVEVRSPGPGEEPSAATPNPVIEIAATIALSHHERWDGLGYPAGLSGTQIPLEARIVGLADSYDALLSERPYRSGFPEEIVLKTIREGAGSHFDPDVCAAFDGILDELRTIRANLADRFDAAPVGGATT
jgi:putative two-component system response regulator